ncbi:hypothetical protein Adi01nite_41180 [Amorphoplanes digitatis]|nr:hypothetical protein Adi01nite_41180 [Actinoplanes digitatis]
MDHPVHDGEDSGAAIMRSSWRSWFWNIALMICTGMMAAVSTPVALEYLGSGVWWAGALFGAMSIALWVAAARSLMIGVTAGPTYVVIRELTRTWKIKWADTVEISDGAPVSGPASLGGATSPQIVVARPGYPRQVVAISGLGSYGLGRGSTPGERAVSGLNEHLSKWRRENP